MLKTRLHARTCRSWFRNSGEFAAFFLHSRSHPAWHRAAITNPFIVGGLNPCADALEQTPRALVSWTAWLLTSRMQSVVSLSAGTRLGVYEIAALIGEGGMGQVYRATDTKLKRQVAIKILPASVAADAERLARFQREARYWPRSTIRRSPESWPRRERGIFRSRHGTGRGRGFVAAHRARADPA